MSDDDDNKRDDRGDGGTTPSEVEELVGEGNDIMSPEEAEPSVPLEDAAEEMYAQGGEEL
jgi:hypothetical protein